jgi:hypothetical protein
MSKIITISREYGSGGKYIGELVAKKLGIPFYDKEIIEGIAEKTGFADDFIARLSEYAPSKSIFEYSFVGRYSSGESIEDIIYNAQRKIILDIAEKGDQWSATAYNLESHWFTHIDAPLHFDPNGLTLSDYPIEDWCITDCLVLDLSYVADNEGITAEMLEKANERNEKQSDRLDAERAKRDELVDLILNNNKK